jgi:hypothetical protein
MSSPDQELFSRHRRASVCEVFVQNTFQVGACGPFHLEFVFFQQAQAGANDFRLVVKPPAGDEPVNYLLEVRGYDFAHAANMQQLQTVVKIVNSGENNLRRSHAEMPKTGTYRGFSAPNCFQ